MDVFLNGVQHRPQSQHVPLGISGEKDEEEEEEEKEILTTGLL